MINDASVVIGGGNWGIKEADVLGYKLINNEYYAREIDFANSTAAGTYTDSTGVVRKSPYNLVQYSEMFSDAYWTKTATVTENTDVAPNGTLTADTLTDSNSAAFLDVRSSLITIVANTTHTTTCFIKKTTGALTHYAGIAVLLSGGTTRVDYGIVNTTNGTVVRDASSNVNSASYSIQDSGNYWRVICTFTDNQSNTSCRVILYPAISANGTSISDTATGSNVFWGAQLVEGASSLPYFPTTTRLNVPRIDYRNADGSLSTTGRLLLEPQRTNVLLYSEQFDNAVWGKGNSGVSLAPVVTANAELAPSGTMTADRIVFDLNGGTTSNDFSQLASASFTYSSETRTQSIYLRTTDNTTKVFSFVSPTGGIASITVTPTYQRFTYTTTGAGAGSIRLRLRGDGEGTATYASIAAWGAQFEVGAYPTTYIPTTTATVTRNADTASRTGVSSWIGQTEGTLFVEYTATSSDTTNATRILNLRNSGFSNQIYIQQNATNSFSAIAYNATNIFSGSTANAFATVGVTYKMAFSYKDGDFAFYINGNQIAISSATGLGTLSIDIVDLSTNVAKSNNITQAVIFPTRLTNSQLQSLTTL